ncbi:MAG: cytochrome c oxidase subunit 3 [Myxococcota bacterium]|nr:cytochrome c oxidase subunit 3 [Myxococcota bacterium]
MSDKPHRPSDDHGHEAAHAQGHTSVFIQHHYDDAQHQFDSGKFAIWLFLAQEVLFFSALFVAYVLYRHHHGEIYSYAHSYLDVKYGAINTGVLIFSSLTAAWAVRAAQLKQRNLLIACLAVTIACALGFLGIKYIEYSHKIHEHILFGRYFDPCVSSGNRPLLSKNNRCAGHESSVVWNAATARATQGCFPDYAIDQNPLAAGVQASCTVSEVKLHYEFTAPDANGAPKVEGPFFPLSKCEAAQSTKAAAMRKAFKPDPTSKDPKAKEPPQPTACVERETPTGTAFPEQCPEWRPSSQPQLKTTKPCWRPGYQPEVCTISYSFTWREADALLFAGPFYSEDECIKAQKLKAGEVSVPPSTCTRSGAVGVIVEYAKHDIRPPEIRVKSQCKGPPPPSTDVVDPLADKEQTLQLGKPAVATGPVPAAQRESSHDAKEREAAGPPPPHTSMFFTIYFAMTGLHGIHVLVGVFVFIWLLIRAVKGHFTPDYFGPVDFAALYWHIVDLIWIFLFPLLYLIH